MELFDRIIESHGRSGIRTFNQIRFSLTLIGPIFIIFGLFGLMGYGAILSNGNVDEGLDREISFGNFLAIGIISQILRLTVFKEKRYINEKNT